MKASRKSKRAQRWSTCSILQSDGGPFHLWRFNLGSNTAHFQGELSAEVLEQSPHTRNWRHLFQPHLYIAWLPVNQVFLRVLHLPPGDSAELASMLELQLEKVSPLPVAQVVWSYEVLSDASAAERTVALVVVARSAAEAFLGGLAPTGFLPDRLEVPLLHQVATDPPAGTVTRLYCQVLGQELVCLTAWWQEHRLESLSLIRVPNQAQGTTLLLEQLGRLAWAGEMEGWLGSKPHWELIIEPEHAPPWEAALRNWAQDACSVRPLAAPKEVAQLSASRAARREATMNLVPQDFATAYHQQFVDRLWMRGLGLLLVLYLVGVVVYAAAVQFYRFRADQLVQEVAQLAPAYTNAMTLKYRLQIAQEQSALQYAALDCLLAVSERLPHALTLETFNFQGGNRLFISGMVAAGDQASVTEFNADLRKAMVRGQPLFSDEGVATPRFSPRGGNMYRWDFTADLNAPWLE